jgi:hypothetical protein
MARGLLDEFGRLLVERVRDAAVSDWDALLDGQMKGDTARKLGPELARFSPEQLEFLHRLLPRVVDTALHHFLWTVEEEPRIHVEYMTDAGHIVPKDRSDGLTVDYVGWVERFSKKKRQDP